MTKRLFCLMGLVLLSGCGSANTTIFDIITADNDGYYEQLASTAEHKELVVPDTAYAENEVAATENVVVGKYNLVKRQERYANADYVITPHDYWVVGMRTSNKMLEEIPGIFAENKNAPVFVEEMVVVDRYLPNGHYSAEKAFRYTVEGSKMFNLTTDKSKADYILKSYVNNIGTPEIPVISYRIELLNKNNKKVGEWQETIRQVLNDDGSWW